ncbi:MAG: hypothetical protein QNL59_09165 [Actinomycetota bacterium]
MTMREECKQYESRSYANGETVRKCNLDLAPEAPWRCPENCSKFELRLVDVDWSHGSLITPPVSPEPESEAIAEVLDEAEDIVNAIGPQILAELEAEQKKANRPLGRLKRKFRRS